MMFPAQPLDWLRNDNYAGFLQEQALAPFLPAINANDSRTIYEQLSEHRACKACLPGLFEFTQDDMLIYPGLPALAPIGMAHHLGERIFIYPPDFALILQLNQSYSLMRVS